MVRLALHNGMRVGEIQSIRRDQVALKRRVLRLSDAKNNSVRTAPLTHAALAAGSPQGQVLPFAFSNDGSWPRVCQNYFRFAKVG
jgi:hypothetical protein